MRRQKDADIRADRQWKGKAATIGGRTKTTDEDGEHHKYLYLSLNTANPSEISNTAIPAQPSPDAYLISPYGLHLRGVEADFLSLGHWQRSARGYPVPSIQSG